MAVSPNATALPPSLAGGFNRRVGGGFNRRFRGGFTDRTSASNVLPKFHSPQTPPSNKIQIMILAYHAIFTAYGFWLPNDPRGSWTQFVASWEILRYGKPIHTNSRASLARNPHDIQKRLAAKSALKLPPVTFTGLQAREIAAGFHTAITASDYHILACAIMPDHIHLVVRRHTHSIERIVGHLKGRASKQLERASLHPFPHHRDRDNQLHSPWAEKCWKVFLDSPADVHRAVRYVNNNPPREGLRPQNWYFLAKNLPPPSPQV